jgi:hypothetical protein
MYDLFRNNQDFFTIVTLYSYAWIYANAKKTVATLVNLSVLVHIFR